MTPQFNSIFLITVICCMEKEALTERFLHFVWEHQQFRHDQLATTDGRPIEVISPGKYNLASGPDFTGATLRIGDILWCGDVEIHVHGSDWKRHGHQHDPAYEHVILHAVFHDDFPVFLKQSGDLPVLQLSSFIRPGQYAEYLDWVGSRKWIPCADRYREIDQNMHATWRSVLIRQRLEEKSQVIFQTLKNCSGDWKETAYRHFASCFGFSTNATAMLMLAENVPLQLLLRNMDQPDSVELILFAAAGLIQDEAKAKEGNYWLRKYGLATLHRSVWKFSGMRPSGFPSVRLTQFCELLVALKGDFLLMLEIELPGEFMKKLLGFLDGDSRLGDEAIRNLMINAIVPLIIAYHHFLGKEDGFSKALSVLENLPPEQNSITKEWKKIGALLMNASDSQSLLHLYRYFCTQKRCLDCAIGASVFDKIKR
jgi:hypothetical protein